MKALKTEFDDGRLSNAVATPTCSSCCCCCCCLATTISSSTLLAKRIHAEGVKNNIPDRNALTALAVLFWPTIGLLAYLGYWVLRELTKTCTETGYSLWGSSQSDVVLTCYDKVSLGLWPVLIVLPLLILYYLYRRVRIKQPLGRAVRVTLLITILFGIEFIGGGLLVLTGVGGIVYLILVPVIIGWVTTWYFKHLRNEKE